MRLVNLQKVARNSALLLALAVVTALSINAQNSNVGNTPANSNTPRTESTSTPRATATSTPQVQTIVEEKTSFPWGLLGLLGLAGLIPKKRSVEVTGVRETERETRTTTDNRDNKSH